MRRALLVLFIALGGLAVWAQHRLAANRAPHRATPKFTVGAYAPPALVADSARWNAFLTLADSTALNAVVLDLVSPAGVHFPSADRLARELSASSETSYDLGARVAQAHARHLFVIGRIDVAEQPRLARARPGWAIRNAGGGRWADARGRPWVSVASDDACHFLGKVAAEAARLGVDEIMLDNLLVPAPRPGARQVHADAEPGTSAHRWVTQCARTIAGPVRRANARLGIALPGRVCTDVGANPAGGQRWEELALLADRISPELYPAATRDAAGRRLGAQPYQAVTAQVGMCYTRNARLIKESGAKPVRVARLEPWVQAWSAGGVAYGPKALGAELQALRDRGVGNALLWNAAGDYARFAPALRPPLPATVVAYNPTPAEWARARQAPAAPAE